MSGDPEQEYFADGMVEDILTALSRVRWLYVIARQSSFSYKGRAVDVKQIGRELGVRYVTEGSVRKFGNRVRVTAQLIDAETEAHLWAASCYARLGRLEDAHSVVEKLRHITPVLVQDAEPWRIQEDRDFYLEGLRLAIGKDGPASP
jgi:TolB-like protein